LPESRIHDVRSPSSVDLAATRVAAARRCCAACERNAQHDATIVLGPLGIENAELPRLRAGGGKRHLIATDVEQRAGDGGARSPCFLHRGCDHVALGDAVEREHELALRLNRSLRGIEVPSGAMHRGHRGVERDAIWRLAGRLRLPPEIRDSAHAHVERAEGLEPQIHRALQHLDQLRRGLAHRLAARQRRDRRVGAPAREHRVETFDLGHRSCQERVGVRL